MQLVSKFTIQLVPIYAMQLVLLHAYAVGLTGKKAKIKHTTAGIRWWSPYAVGFKKCYVGWVATSEYLLLCVLFLLFYPSYLFCFQFCCYSTFTSLPFLGDWAAILTNS